MTKADENGLFGGIAELRKQLAAALAACKLKDEALQEVVDLIGESSGIYGMHLNGDPSPWDEIERGGRFERLTLLQEALAIHPDDSALKAWLGEPQPCRSDGRCQYAIDHGAEGLGHCPAEKCCMPLYSPKGLK